MSPFLEFALQSPHVVFPPFAATCNKTFQKFFIKVFLIIVKTVS